MLFYMAYLNRLLIGYSMYKTGQLDWWVELEAQNIEHQFFVDYTGYQSDNELRTKYYFLRTKHWMAWRQNI